MEQLATGRLFLSVFFLQLPLTMALVVAANYGKQIKPYAYNGDKFASQLPYLEQC